MSDHNTQTAAQTLTLVKETLATIEPTGENAIPFSAVLGMIAAEAVHLTIPSDKKCVSDVMDTLHDATTPDEALRRIPNKVTRMNVYAPLCSIFCGATTSECTDIIRRVFSFLQKDPLAQDIVVGNNRAKALSHSVGTAQDNMTAVATSLLTPSEAIEFMSFRVSCFSLKQLLEKSMLTRVKSSVISNIILSSMIRHKK